jgi:hypothetical protein
VKNTLNNSHTDRRDRLILAAVEAGRIPRDQIANWRRQWDAAPLATEKSLNGPPDTSVSADEMAALFPGREF